MSFMEMYLAALKWSSAILLAIFTIALILIVLFGLIAAATGKYEDDDDL